MGCDGFITDIKKPVTVTIRCHKCGKVIELGKPIEGHDECMCELWLPVDVDIDNYMKR